MTPKCTRTRTRTRIVVAMPPRMHRTLIAQSAARDSSLARRAERGDELAQAVPIRGVSGVVAELIEQLIYGANKRAAVEATNRANDKFNNSDKGERRTKR